MIFNEFITEMLYKEQTKKLDQITKNGWQLWEQQSVPPSPLCCPKPTVQVQTPCNC